MQMKRCGNAISCNSLINLKGSHVRLGDRLFCCNDCVQEYLAQEKRLENAMNPFKYWVPPERHVPQKVPIQGEQLEMQLDD